MFFKEDLNTPDKNGCHYALIYPSDTNKRLVFYDCDNHILISQCFDLDFKPKKDNLNSHRNGEELQFYPDGAIARRTIFKMGKKNGQETEYYQSGKIKYSRIFIDDKLDGYEIYSNESGEAVFKGKHKKGKRYSGIWHGESYNGFIYTKEYSEFQIVRSIYFSAELDTLTEYQYTIDKDTSKLKLARLFKEGKFEKNQIFQPRYRDSIILRDTIKKEGEAMKSLAEQEDKDNHPPVFQNGNEDFQAYLQENLSYPKLALDREIQGIIRVYFIIGREGNVIDVFTNGKGNEFLTAEAIRFVERTDAHWTSAKKKGEIVIITCIIPITFSIN